MKHFAIHRFLRRLLALPLVVLHVVLLGGLMVMPGIIFSRVVIDLINASQVYNNLFDLLVMLTATILCGCSPIILMIGASVEKMPMKWRATAIRLRKQKFLLQPLSMAYFILAFMFVTGPVWVFTMKDLRFSYGVAISVTLLVYSLTNLCSGMMLRQFHEYLSNTIEENKRMNRSSESTDF